MSIHFLPSFGITELDIGWLRDNAGLPALFVVLFGFAVAMSWTTLKKAAEQFLKARPAAAAACLVAGLLLYMNLFWLPPFLCAAIVAAVLLVPPLRRRPARWTVTAALVAYLLGYSLQAGADRVVHRLTWGVGPGLILLPDPDAVDPTSGEAGSKGDLFKLYSQLRRGLIDSFQSVDALYVVPTAEPDEKSFDADYAAIAERPDQIDHLSRFLALSGQSLDIIVEANFVDASVCGIRRWRATMQPKIWRKNGWRPWASGRIDPDTNWQITDHPDMLARDDELQLFGLMGGYELAEYFSSGKTVRLSDDNAKRIWGNLLDRFYNFIWRIQDSHKLPPALEQAIKNLDRNDPARVRATLKDTVAFFRTAPVPSPSAECAERAQRAPATALSGLSRE